MSRGDPETKCHSVGAHVRAAKPDEDGNGVGGKFHAGRGCLLVSDSPST